MKKTATHLSYNNLVFRIIAALSVGIFMVFYGSKLKPFRAILMLDFYISLLGSFIIALLLINTVHFATVILDKRLNWLEAFIPRLCFQLLFGFFIPCILAYFLAAFYFAAYGLNINTDTDYLTFDYPWVVTLLFGLNVYYGFYFAAGIFGLNIRLNKWKIQLYLPVKTEALETIKLYDQVHEEQTANYSPIILYKGSSIVSVDITETIAFFYCSQKQYWAISLEGDLYAIRQNLSEIEKHYDGQQFFRINRQVILNRKIIKGYHHDELGQTQVTLFPVPVRKGNELDQNYFIVSGSRVKKFLRWME